MFLGVTGKLTSMSYTAEERQVIADKVRRARVSQQLDKEPAARAAGVNSITWKRVEDAESVRDASLQKVLSSLGLPSADELLDPQGTIDATDTAWLESGNEPATDYHVPDFLPAVRLTWEAVTELAASPDGDPDRSKKAVRAVIITADTLTDALLRLNIGPAAKSLIQEMGGRTHEIVLRNQAPADASTPAEATQADFDLAGGDRDLGTESEGRRRRRKQDEAAEQPDE